MTGMPNIERRPEKLDLRMRIPAGIVLLSDDMPTQAIFTARLFGVTA